MEPVAEQAVPDVSAEQRASNDKIKLIRKLRWMGLEREARRLQGALPAALQADSVVPEPSETD